MPNPAIGVQLYTVRDACQGDFLGTLRAVREIGYPAVEGFWSLFGHPPAAVRRELERLGWCMPSAHVDLDTLERASTRRSRPGASSDAARWSVPG